MSNENKHETVADIVAEMRRESDNRMEDASCYTECALLRDYADRIEAASKRDCEQDCVWYHVYNDGLSELRKENDRLRVALKPVLEVDCQLDNYPTKEAYMAALEIVVSEAQRIYNEGGAE